MCKSTLELKKVLINIKVSEWYGLTTSMNYPLMSSIALLVQCGFGEIKKKKKGIGERKEKRHHLGILQLTLPHFLSNSA